MKRIAVRLILEMLSSNTNNLQVQQCTESRRERGSRKKRRSTGIKRRGESLGKSPCGELGKAATLAC